MPDWFRPRKDGPSVTITDISLEITTHPEILRLLKGSTELPQVPQKPLNSHEVRRFLVSLTALAANTCDALKAFEDDARRISFKKSQEERVQILVISRGKLVGRVNGARQIFNARGVMISDGKS